MTHSRPHAEPAKRPWVLDPHSPGIPPVVQYDVVVVVVMVLVVVVVLVVKLESLWLCRELVTMELVMALLLLASLSMMLCSGGMPPVRPAAEREEGPSLEDELGPEPEPW